MQVSRSQIPEGVIQITKTLENKGFQAWIVGGCVRDLLLGKKPKDWDITTNATPPSSWRRHEPHPEVAVTEFISGAVSMGSFTAGLLFLRSYRHTRDRLFVFFAAGFFLLAADRVALVLLSTQGEFGFAVYLLRLLAFLLILAGIADKNARRSRPR